MDLPGVGVKLRVVSRRSVSKCKRPSRGEQRRWSGATGKTQGGPQARMDLPGVGAKLRVVSRRGVIKCKFVFPRPVLWPAAPWGRNGFDGDGEAG